ncbi:hypothetical protein, partial [Enterococcus gallinarum]|uniref:hypothetical protein n=1 Tax=Enterococcus gallinarum TaxID=1353 RepID=UPI001C847557
MINNLKHNQFTTSLISLFISANLISYSLGNYDYNKYIYVLTLFIIIIKTRKVKISLISFLFFFITLIFSHLDGFSLSGSST